MKHLKTFAVAAVLAAACLAFFNPAAFGAPAKAKKKKAAAEARKTGPETPGDFYRQLKRKPVATIEDVVRAVARYQGYSGPANLQREVEFLNSRGIRFRRDVMPAAGLPVTKGTAVHMFMTAMKYRGCLMRWVLPGSQRVAVRVAMHKKILPADSIAAEKMTGGDLLALLTRVVEAKQGHAAAEEEGGASDE